MCNTLSPLQAACLQTGGAAASSVPPSARLGGSVVVCPATCCTEMASAAWPPVSHAEPSCTSLAAFNFCCRTSSCTMMLWLFSRTSTVSAGRQSSGCTSNPPRRRRGWNPGGGSKRSYHRFGLRPRPEKCKLRTPCGTRLVSQVLDVVVKTTRDI